MASDEQLRDYLKRVTIDLHDTRLRLREAEQRGREPIAIVGMSCRYPGDVGSPEELWEVVAHGRDALSVWPTDRGWERLFASDPDALGAGVVRESGFLSDAAGFDPGFFGIGPREALAMDPQQRQWLEVSWEAFEAAGIDPGSLRGAPIGVFAGISAHEYMEALAHSSSLAGLAGYMMTGTLGSLVSGRVAYVLGLEGPAMTVDTACSSSLVALHLACGALRAGDCELALAGGVTVLCTPVAFTEFARQGGLAPDGRCKSFARAADGTSFSEGVGALVLERLSDARRNGHAVLAVVRGSAVNQDGASNGLTAPNGPAQQRVIRSALANAGLSAGEVDVVEAHGTGTMLGDPIEAQALIATYGEAREQGRPLRLGSIKSNLGHTQAAAGVAGVIKTVMAMRHGILPQTLHVDEPSQQVDWSAGTVSLLRDATPWVRSGEPRRAGVSSFGISGTNAHVILEEAPEAEAVAPGWRASGEPANGARANGALVADGHPVVVEEVGADARAAPAFPLLPWVLSGKGAPALHAQAERLRARVAADGGLRFEDVAFSLTRRAAFEERAVVLIEPPPDREREDPELPPDREREDPLGGLGALAAGERAPGVILGTASRGEGRMAFLFTGQGAQRAGMGRELYGAFPAFRDALSEACGHLDGLLGRSLRDVMFGEGGDDPGLLDQTMYTQAGLFALEVALFRLLESWGVHPDFVIGHSIGELAAAHVAGVFSLEDACGLVAARGRLMGELPGGGAMLAVAAGEREALESLAGHEGRVALAAVNGPAAVVLSGDEDAVGELAGAWEARGRRVKRLRVSHAFHSPRMDAMLAEFAQVAAGVSFAAPRIPVVSNVTGELAAEEQLCDPEYWVRQVREPVRFADGIRRLEREGVRGFVELGPDGVLSAMADDCLRQGGAEDGSAWNGGAPPRHDGASTHNGGEFERDGGELERDEDRPVLVALLRGDRPQARSLLSALAELWVRGMRVDWGRMLAGTGANRVELPAYAFQRERYWFETPAPGARDAAAAGQDTTGHPLLGAPLGLAAGEGLLFTGQLSLRTHPWLADHAVMGTVLLPGTAFVELALHAGGQVGCSTLAELVVETPLVLSDEDTVRLQVWLSEPDESGSWSVGIYSCSHSDREEDAWPGGEEWVRHAGGVLRGDLPIAQALTAPVAGQPTDSDGEPEGPLGGVWPPPDAVELPLEGFYEGLAEVGFEYGPAFQGLRAMWRRGEDVFAEVSLPEDQHEQAARLGIHPALLDAALHGIAALAAVDAGLPFAWSGVSLHAIGASTLRVRLARTGNGAVSLLAADEDGGLVVSIDSLALRPVAREQLESARDRRHDSLFGVEWTPVAVGGAAARDVELVALAEAVDGGVPVGEVVFVRCPGAVVDETGVSGGGVVGAAHRVARDVLALLRQWLVDQRFADSRLVLVTEGAVAVGAEEVPGLACAAVWGLVRSAQSENPGRFVLIDVDGEEASWAALDTALAGDEQQLAVREGEVLAPRLARAGADGALTAPPGSSAWRLEVGGGTLEDMALVAHPEAQRALDAGEVRVAVRCAGVNFRDVLIALRLYPGAAQVGGEVAGEVVEVGPGVEDLARGDRVMGLVGSGFGPVGVADRRLLVRVPEGWSFAQAATVPIAFLTAFYGLRDLAGVQPGERLLVHAATGGVGMAAVQLARHWGVEVFGTASPPKWGTLEAQGLDGAHIASSRTLEFRERFLEATGGGGVDVVLDCLAREFVDASLELLPGGGRFVEMGKTDIRDAEEVAARHPGVAYRAFDLMEAGPDRIREMLEELVGLFEGGALRPLPLREWDVRRAPEAFRFLSQARHTGKIVLKVPAGIDPGGTALITGGMGDLGALVARHLVREHGVRSLMLAGRRGGEAPGAVELAAELEGMGAGVRLVACDVSDREDVRALLESLPEEYPLKLVVHAAGVLDDGVIESLTEGRVERVLAPKVAGAWHLHELTEHLDLTGFVLFSSAAGTLGSPGQGSYAAANAFLDALAAYRRARGLVGGSLAWGLWEQAGGMTGGLDEASISRIERAGVAALSAEEGLELFDAALETDRALLVPMRLDLQELRRFASAGAPLPGIFRGLVRAPARRAARADTSGWLAQRIAGAPAEERPGVMLEFIRGEVAGVLGYASGEAVSARRAFKELGLDSLAGVELRNRLAASVGRALPATLVFDHPSPAALAEYLLGEVMGAGGVVVSVAPASAVMDEPVAIVGMSCRYPGPAHLARSVGSPGELWELLVGDGDAIGGFPSDRGWDLEGWYAAVPDALRESGFLYDAAEFDAAFFGIGPREALAMDPQQRLLLEAAWEALEDAGIAPDTLRGSPTAVYAGLMYHDYTARLRSVPLEVMGYLATGNSGSVVSGRVAYAFGLEGPAVTIDTACSSSLVALHMACVALRGGECSLALAGGVTVMSSPMAFLEFGRQGGLAPDGRCKSFADAADGVSWSEGVGMLVLERLSDARRNGHEVLAVVRGSAVNQDGASNGLTAPNGPSQQRVIMQALANARLDPCEVDVVEGHGTGTTLGDPIEAQALLATYGQNRPAGAPLLLGSIKSNIGHTQAAAGVAGVIKVVQALRHGLLPRTLHVDEPSRQVDWSAGAVSLLRETTPWPRNGRPRRAGVSSFGISGTNAHMIVEEAPAVEDASEAAPVVDGQGLAGAGVVPWVLSGRGAAGLEGQARRLLERASGDPGRRALDVGYALAGRTALEDRAVLIESPPTPGREELLAGLGALAGGERALGVVRGIAGADGRVAFLFTGQGAQRVGMGRELYEAFPVFREAFDEVCGHLDEPLGGSLREVVCGGEVGSGESRSGEMRAGELHAGGELAGGGLLDETMFTQAGLFALEVALFRLLDSWGVRPDFVIGHSIGELAAAHVAGVFSLGDACRLVAARGRLMGELPAGGAMVAVAAAEREALESLAGFEGRVALAAVNGPSAVVLSGDEDAVGELAGVWEGRGRKVKRLRVSHAFHSPRMDGMLGEFAEVAGGVAYGEPRIPVVSNVTGELAGEGLLSDAGYWVRHVREPVRFAEGVGWLAGQGVRHFLELGPDGVLSAMTHDCLDGERGEGAEQREGGPLRGEDRATAVAVLRNGRPEARSLVAALAEMWVRGVAVDWRTLFAGSDARRAELPTYAFQRERYWLEMGAASAGDTRAAGLERVEHPLLGAAVVLAGGDGLLFTGRLSLQTHPWLADHQVMGTVLLPGTALVELALHAGGQVGCPTLGELVIEIPLAIPREGAVQLQVAVGGVDESGARPVSIHSRPEDAQGSGLDEGGGEWIRHAGGMLLADGWGAQARAAAEARARELGAAWPPPDAAEVALDGLYDGLAELGLEYGPAFQGLGRVWRRGSEVFADVALPEGRALEGGAFGLHPALLDAALHAVGVGLGGGSANGDGGAAGGVLLPFSWDRVGLYAVGATSLRVCLSVDAGAGAGAGGVAGGVAGVARGSVSLVAADEAGGLVASVGSLVLREASASQFGRVRGGGRESLYCLDWVALDGLPDAGAEPPELVFVECEPGPAVPAATVPESGGLVEQAVVGPGPDGAAGRAHAEVRRVLALLQGWLAGERSSGQRLAIVTRGAVAVRDREDVVSLAGAAVWGLVRSAQSENPGRFVLIDVDGEEASWAALDTALAGDEQQLAVREGEVLAPRLARAGADGALTAPPGSSAWRLEVGGGTLEDMALVAHPEAQRALDAGEVRVAVRCAGVNFRDVLIALRLYPGAAQVGGEVAGEVVEVGPGVEDLARGDRVMGLVGSGFGPVGVADRRLLVRVPEGWSFAQAATVPIAFLTAFYGLRDLAGVQPGERLLVHAATGGVGMAAVQLARHWGVEVFGTASPPKWGTLEAQGLDGAHIASSRTLEFRERFLEATGGGGVDVVLDCLAREFVDASLELLPGGGRFVEMGKTDIRDAEEVAARHPGVAYRAFDLMEAGPDRIREMLEELVGLFEGGALRPLPLREWDVRRAPEAFRFLSQARHTGKIVLKVPAGIDPGGTALITGGMGDLGALVARHLVREHGVRSLMLVSRRGGEAPGAHELADELVELGARVRLAACDVADREQVRALLGSVPGEHPLRLVVHTAGVLDDGVIDSLTASRVQRVLAPKVDGAWHLHELTAHLDLTGFVLFSSAAGTLGNPGQGSYAAANAFLDGLAAHRRANGLAGESLAWGLWEQAGGMAGGLDEASVSRLERAGVGALSPEEGLELLDTALAADRALLVPMRLDLQELRRFAGAGALLPGIFRGLVRASARRVVRDTSGWLAERVAGLSGEERERMVLELVRGEVAGVLGYASSESVPPGRAFSELGLDSLAAVELRNRLAAGAGRGLPATLVFDHPTPVGLARYLLGELTDAGRAVVSVAAAGVAVDEPVAIVGMSCRYPGGDRSVGSPGELWELLVGDGDAIGGFPVDRGWDLEGWYAAVPDAVRESGFLHDAGMFDAGFFGIGPREALAMDPQQRLLLEASWEALEDAGIAPDSLRGSPTAVFAGLMYHDYTAGLRSLPAEVMGYLGTGNLGSVLSGRVSYAFGFEGPAVTIDTACSSSLVALHLACGALRGGECSLALAGGVTVMGTPMAFLEFGRQGGLAPDGRCKSFADAADGVSWSEGVGVLVLERLSDARRNGHEVLAVVRGSAVNQDGASNGLTAPNGPSQQRVIRQALANARVTPGEVDVVEGHGTGTTLGDPIEAQALLATYGQDRDPESPLLLGSIKSNIGHTQAAAGVAGVIKIVQALRHGLLPRTLHVDEPSRQVDWDTGAVELLREPAPWPRNGRPRRAGVSSFGISGTNAHMILEEAPPREDAPGQMPLPEGEGLAGAGVVPWVLSGRGAAGVEGQARRLWECVSGDPELPVLDVGCSLAARAVFEDRAVVVGGGRDDLVGGAGALACGEPALGVVRGVVGVGGRVAFLFTGQGAQRVGMGRELHEAFPVFREAIEEVWGHLDPLLGCSLREVMFGEAGSDGGRSAVVDSDGAGSDGARADGVQPGGDLLDQTMFTQAGLFALEVALFALTEGWGVSPDFVIGHSIGELAAAYVAGVFSLEDACRLVAARGRLMGELPAGGAMVAVEAGEEEALEGLAGYEGRVALAAVNGPTSVVLSGDEDAVLELADTWEARGRRVKRLRVSHAFHSPRMGGMLEEFARVAETVSFAEPRIPVVSNVTGELAGEGLLCDAGYWVRHVREPVRFADGVRRLEGEGVRSFLELGPDGVLSAMANDCLREGDPEKDGDRPVVAAVLRGDRPEARSLLSALAEVWVRGARVDWGRMFEGSGAACVRLPAYAFQRERYWLGTGESGAGDPAAAGLEQTAHPLFGGTAEVASPSGLQADDRARGSLAARLAGLPAQERERAAREAVRAEVAAVLGWASAEAVQPQRLFLELGLDSLAAVELRNRLGAQTGLRLPATAVFDHPTPAALADRLLAELAAAREGGASWEAAAAGRPAAGWRATGGPADTLSSLLARAEELGRVDEFVGMVATAASLRPTFDGCLDADEAPAPIRLCEGPGQAGLVCLPSLLATGGPHQYVRFARAFRDMCEVSALRAPGFLDGERVPNGMRSAVETLAATVLRASGDAPIVLLGHSSGGLLAYAVAGQLEEAGVRAAAVVLIDTYWSGAFGTALPLALGGALASQGAYAFGGMLGRQSPDATGGMSGHRGSYAPVNDANLTAMTLYGRFMEQWEPRALPAPTLLVRASAPMSGAAQEDDGEWRASVAVAHTAIDVPGDHFSMMDEHVEATAAAVREWLLGVLGP
jgi:acyl transferase domain-containing protein/NADPH:quinone reductase-like Zn-dependent oxidoreductase/thioesterase domain-containing protein/short-subunit dehydrogenase